MRITMEGGETYTLPGCLARFGAHLGVISPGFEITHIIQGGRLWKVSGPGGSKREHLGVINRVEV